MSYALTLTAEGARAVAQAAVDSQPIILSEMTLYDHSISYHNWISCIPAGTNGTYYGDFVNNWDRVFTATQLNIYFEVNNQTELFAEGTLSPSISIGINEHKSLSFTWEFKTGPNQDTSVDFCGATTYASLIGIGANNLTSVGDEQHPVYLQNGQFKVAEGADFKAILGNQYDQGNNVLGNVTTSSSNWLRQAFRILDKTYPSGTSGTSWQWRDTENIATPPDKNKFHPSMESAETLVIDSSSYFVQDSSDESKYVLTDPDSEQPCKFTISQYSYVNIELTVSGTVYHFSCSPNNLIEHPSEHKLYSILMQPPISITETIIGFDITDGENQAELVAYTARNFDSLKIQWTPVNYLPIIAFQGRGYTAVPSLSSSDTKFGTDGDDDFYVKGRIYNQNGSQDYGEYTIDIGHNNAISVKMPNNACYCADPQSDANGFTNILYWHPLAQANLELRAKKSVFLETGVRKVGYITFSKELTDAYEGNGNNIIRGKMVTNSYYVPEHKHALGAITITDSETKITISNSFEVQGSSLTRDLLVRGYRTRNIVGQLTGYQGFVQDVFTGNVPQQATISINQYTNSDNAYMEFNTAVQMEGEFKIDVLDVEAVALSIGEVSVTPTAITANKIQASADLIEFDSSSGTTMSNQLVPSTDWNSSRWHFDSGDPDDFDIIPGAYLYIPDDYTNPPPLIMPFTRTKITFYDPEQPTVIKEVKYCEAASWANQGVNGNTLADLAENTVLVVTGNTLDLLNMLYLRQMPDHQSLILCPASGIFWAIWYDPENTDPSTLWSHFTVESAPAVKASKCPAVYCPISDDSVTSYGYYGPESLNLHYQSDIELTKSNLSAGRLKLTGWDIDQQTMTISQDILDITPTDIQINGNTVLHGSTNASGNTIYDDPSSYDTDSDGRPILLTATQIKEMIEAAIINATT